MKQVVLDTSVAVKWIRQQEEYSSQALQLRERYLKGDLEIAIPDHLLYELANALRFKPDVSREDIRKAIDTFLDEGLEVIYPAPAILHEAINISFEHDITFYDALFLAVAESIRYDFITADKIFYQKIAKRPDSHLLSELAI